MKLRNTLLVLATASASLTVFAGAIDDARALYHDAQYEAVVEKLAPVLKRTPKDGNANFFSGASLQQLGRVDEAIPLLKMAQTRGVTEASRMLAQISLERYEVDEAQDALDRWSAALRKAKKAEPAELTEMNSRLVQMSNMLERVENIEVLDSMVVDRDNFFSYFKLSPTAGKILPADAISRLGGDTGILSLAYMPENGSELLWAAADSVGTYRLYGADILDDGTIDHAAPLDDSLGAGGDARYPFLMPDGMTLYFASNGEGSLGGYDIFMTRRTQGDDGSTYFQPQNIGMPYNSPYDDYMLAIDETSGLGWWATDRNQIPGKLTIYIFAPSQMRVNVDSSNPALTSLARLSDISLTHRPGVDYQAMLASRLPKDDAAGPAVASPKFALDMGNGHVYTSLKDFRSDRARSAMLEALAMDAKLRKHLEKEDALRERYRRGDHSVDRAIIASEADTEAMRRSIRAKVNAAIRAEK